MARPIPLSGGRKILPTREDLERMPLHFFGQGKRGRGGGGGGGPQPVVRNALWANGWNLDSPSYAAAQVNIGQPHTYSPWNADKNLWLSMWVHVYNTADTNNHPFFCIWTPTYNAGMEFGSETNRAASGAFQGGSYHYGLWNDSAATVLGDAGTGTGSFVDQEWHHIACFFNWNGTLYIDGKRTWFNTHQSSNCTWQVNPASSNGWRDLYLSLGGRKNHNIERPYTSAFGICNVSLWEHGSMDYDEFADVVPIEDNSHVFDRFVTWNMQNLIDNSKSGLLFGYPLQDDANDVGPYSKHLTLNADAECFIADSNGTYDGPTF